MPLLTIVPPMPGAERCFKPFVDFVHRAGWETEFVRLEWNGDQPNFDSTALFSQVDLQTAGKVVMGYSLAALCAPAISSLDQSRRSSWRMTTSRSAG